MNCQDCHAFLDAYLDNELDAAGALAIQQHLQECPECQTALESMRNLQAILRRPEMRYQASAGAREQVVAVLARENTAVAQKPAGRKIIPIFIPWAIAAALALLAGLAWFNAQTRSGRAAEGPLVAELVAGHIRSLQADHLLDLTSSDHRKIEPWFAERLQYAPPVWALDDSGIELLGGRLDYLANVAKRAVSVLVYKYEGHIINVYMWPSKIKEELEGELSASNGFNLLHWRKNGMACWAVSDASPELLKRFYERVDALSS
jgi:anti-sigma factor RsiW